MKRAPIDSPISDFDYPIEDEPIVNIVDVFREILDRMHEYADLEAERMKDPDWRYEQVWLMSKEAAMNLPKNPTLLDYAKAGARFHGWQWVYHGEEDETNSD
jgi:hypothetical protein